MLRPYFSVIVLGIVLAVMFEPLYQRLLAWLRSPSWSAFLTTLIVLALVLLPLTLFITQLAQEAAGLYGHLSQRTDGNGLAQLITQGQQWVQRLIPEFSLNPSDVAGFVRSGLGLVVNNVGFVFAEFARIIIGFLMTLLVFYYLVKDGKSLLEHLVAASPLSDEHEHEIVATLARAINSVVRGSLVIALAQGLVAGIGFSLFSVPNPALWAGLLMLASFIPTFGTALIQVPIVIYVLLAGQTGDAIALTAWAVIVVGLIDNILRPMLVGRATRIHPIVTLFAVLGGITLFGPIGLILGPVVMSLLFALSDIWVRTIRRKA